MKKYLFALFFISTIAQAQIEFGYEEYNFGSINQGDTVICDFNFTNKGSQSVTVTNVTAACTCLVPNFSTMPVPPNGKGTITLTYISAGKMGMQDKGAVVIAGSTVVTLHVKGNVNFSMSGEKSKPKTIHETVPVASSTAIAETKPVEEPAKVEEKPEKPAPKQTKILNFNDMIDITSMMDKTYWSLAVVYHSDGRNPSKPEEVITDISKFINNGKTGHEIDKTYLKKHKAAIDSSLNNMRLVGNSLGQFVYLEDSEVPVRFCSYKEASKLFYITGIALDDVYNTLRLTSRQRARKVITEYILPSIKNIKPMLGKEFDYVGLGAVYGCKDLSDKYATTKSEYIGFIVSSKNARDFMSGKITEDALVESADIISADMDMITGTKRIKIVLE